jgi:hypothetical protein
MFASQSLREMAFVRRKAAKTQPEHSFAGSMATALPHRLADIDTGAARRITPIQRAITGPVNGQPQGTVRPMLHGGAGLPAIGFGFANGDTVDMLAARVRAIAHSSFPAGYTVTIYLHDAPIGWGTALVDGGQYEAHFAPAAPLWGTNTTFLSPPSAPTGGSGPSKLSGAEEQHALGSLLGDLDRLT